MNEITIPLKDLSRVQEKLEWMKKNKVWPNGRRYLLADSFGLVLLVTLYNETKDKKYLQMADSLVSEVYRVLGSKKGIRIGEEEDKNGQYYHYLIMWVFALWKLSEVDSKYNDYPIELINQIHKPFVHKGFGVYWKMEGDLSKPYSNYGYGPMDHYLGYVIYRLIDNGRNLLTEEIQDMKEIVDKTYLEAYVDEDLNAGMLLWICHFFPNEDWAKHILKDCLVQLNTMWIDPPGYFCRTSVEKSIKFAFSNYAISLGLQSNKYWDDRVAKINNYFDTYKSNDEYDTKSITHVMGCVSYFPGKFLKDEPKNN